MGAPNVLLLDEPGNDLDIETLTILEDYLTGFPGAVIAVSHDRFFLHRIAEKILVLQPQGRVAEYPGNYSDYLRLSATQPVSPSAQEVEPGQVILRIAPVSAKLKPLKFKFSEQKEFEEIDLKITRAEQDLQALDAQLQAAASDYQRLGNLTRLRLEAEQRLEYLLERWIYLNEIAEAIGKPND
jgi:ABC transport system ATP-binding/permease protein